MVRRLITLGTALLLAPAASGAQHGWVNVPGQGWRYQVTVSAPDAAFGCNMRIVGATCTPSGNSLLIAHGQEQLTLSWQPEPAATVVIDPSSQSATTNFVTLGSWKWSATPGFTFPKLQPGVRSYLFVATVGDYAPGACSTSCWMMAYWGFHTATSDRQITITPARTDVAYLFPRATPHPVTGYSNYLLFLQKTTPYRVVIDASTTEGEVDVSMQVALAPEPSTFALLGGGVALLLGVAHRRRRHVRSPNGRAPAP